jgi:hypothetical protein
MPERERRRWIRLVVTGAVLVLVFAVAIAACTWANSLQ